jgi:hypothetical protein
MIKGTYVRTTVRSYHEGILICERKMNKER